MRGNEEGPSAEPNEYAYEHMVAILKSSLVFLPFTTEEQCIEAFYNAKWPHGFRCPSCEHCTAYTIQTRKLPLYECAACGKQTSLIANTALSGSRIPLLKWFQAFYLHTEHEGINAVRLSRVLGVTYKTAWLIGHKLRMVMRTAEQARLLKGNVLITNVIYAQQYTDSFDWQKPEQPVLIGGVEDERQHVVQMTLQLQPKELLSKRGSKPDIQPFLADCLSAESTNAVFLPQNTSERRYPQPLPRTPEGGLQEREERARKLRLKQIVWAAHGWISRLFGGVSSKHLQAYFDQFSYLWHRRHEWTLSMFMTECAAVHVTTYPILTGSRNESALERSLRKNKASQRTNAINLQSSRQ